MSELYTKEILRLAAGTPVISRLRGAAISVTKTSRICGSRITVDVNIEQGRVSAYGQEVKACALGQASSAIVASHVIGKTWAELSPVGEAVEKLLKGEDGPPGGEWADYCAFIPARQHKSRHSAIMLPFAALKEAFVIYEQAKKKSA